MKGDKSSITSSSEVGDNLSSSSVVGDNMSSSSIKKPYNEILDIYVKLCIERGTIA